MEERVVEVPGMRFRGVKIYLESSKDDEINVKYFADFVEDHTGRRQDSLFYHLKAKQVLGTG